MTFMSIFLMRVNWYFFSISRKNSTKYKVSIKQTKSPFVIESEKQYLLFSGYKVYAPKYEKNVIRHSGNTFMGFHAPIVGIGNRR